MQEKYSNLICDYLRSRPAIAATTIEKKLGLPDSTIRQALAGAQLIPEKHIFPIVCYLSGYGLTIDGYTLSYDPADDTLSGRKWVENVGTEEDGDGFVYIVKEYRFFASSYSDLL